MKAMDFVAAQSDALEPIGFQREIIHNLTRALLSQPSPPCLLRSPTGSGKTFMLVRALAKVSAEQDTVWLWFVPFVNLVQQTEDSILANAAGQLFPVMLARGRNQEPSTGMVLLSTAQGVARAVDRKSGYSNDMDDDERALNEFVELARARKLRIGLVVDEAHIGLNSGTEFGKFAHWLNPDYLVMASATPKDAVLDQFLTQAGKGARTSFTVSRAEAVEARLNKRYIEAVIYDLQRTIATVTDLKRTVLRQAWKKQLQLKKLLSAAGIDLTPLLLVQVSNGDKTVEEARDDLVRLCRVPPGKIGMHSSDAPDPVLMAAIANDYTKEVLIFKQSAGTGFDAPRAFILASTKLVNDADFAMQFIGRVMRVANQVRKTFPKPTLIPPELDTAFIYLADANAQQGFQSAVNTVGAVKSELEGQTEQMVIKKTASGATVITSRTTPQLPVTYEETRVLPDVEDEDEDEDETPVAPTESTQIDLFFGGGKLEPIDPGTVIMQWDKVVPSPTAVSTLPVNETEVLERLQAQGLKAYMRNVQLQGVPTAFKRETRPQMADMAKVSAKAAEELILNEALVSFAVRAAYNLLDEKELHTELTQGTSTEETVMVVTDRNAVTREVVATLRKIPQIEDEDIRVIIGTLASRLREHVAVPPSDDVAKVVGDKELNRLARDAACWVIRREAQRLAEAIQDAVSEFATVDHAEPLPDAMLYPLKHALKDSKKNLYGVVPPFESKLADEKGDLGMDAASSMAAPKVVHQSGQLTVSGYDWTSAVNNEEHDFIDSLDRDKHVVWWHRNPRNKPWAVRVVRGEHRNYFYPDFIVCLEHPIGHPPEIRLVETKESTKDASRKARRTPKIYDKVLFITRDDSKLRIVNDNGSLGAEFDWMDLTPAWDWMMKNRRTN
jgi:hypothetical protein